MSIIIELEDDVYRELQRIAIPFQDTPSSVIRRLLSLSAPAQEAEGDVGLDHEELETSAGNNRVNSSGRRAPGQGRMSKRRRAPKGSILPESAYEIPILEVLEENGGTAQASEVLEMLSDKLDSQLKPLDQGHLASGRLRWHNRAQFVRLHLVKRGDMKDDSPRGLWEISEQGRARLDQKR